MTTPFQTIDRVSIRRLISDRLALLQQPARAARLIITGEAVGSVPVYIPYAPPNVEHSDLGGEYVTVNRPGLPDTTAYVSTKVPRMSMSLLITDKVVANPAQGQGTYATYVTGLSVIKALQAYTSSGSRVRVTYGEFESGLWYIDSMSMATVRRDPLTDEITQANVDLTFIKSSDVVDGTGPVTGGVKPPAPTAATPPPQQTSARYYTFKKGDTLWGVSVMFYGTGTKWRMIADANGITNPNTIPVGKVVRVP